MRNIMTLLGICIVVLVACNVTLVAQELDANVIVNIERLERDQAIELRTMANDVRTYLNSQRYTNTDWEGEKIPVDVNIWVLGRSGNRFSARVAIVSKRLVNNQPGTGAAMLRVNDQQWMFEWNFSPTLSFQSTRYDEFTSVLDFYMLLAIGLDMDTYEDLGGTDAFRLAQQIAQLGNAAGVEAFKTFYQPGEFTRMSLVNEMLDLRYQGFRRLLFDYHEGIDMVATNKMEGQKAVAAVLAEIARFKREKVSNRSVFLQAFFDAKHMELADVFKGVKDEELWSNLRFLDAGNTQIYEAARAAR